MWKDNAYRNGREICWFIIRYLLIYSLDLHIYCRWAINTICCQQILEHYFFQKSRAILSTYSVALFFVKIVSTYSVDYKVSTYSRADHPLGLFFLHIVLTTYSVDNIWNSMWSQNALRNCVFNTPITVSLWCVPKPCQESCNLPHQSQL